MARYSCEYDILVVGAERRPPISLRIADDFVDLTFATEREVLKPPSPENSMSLAFAKPIRDTSLVLSTASAASSATLAESSKMASRARLASALKTLGRAEVAVYRGWTTDADFLLLSASYELAYAWLLSKEILPSPSHLLAQLRQVAKNEPMRFEAFSVGAGLEAAGRAGCGARLEGVTVVHDLLRKGTKTPDPRWSEVRTEITGSKAREIMTRIELAECYSFLGQELEAGVLALLGRHPRSNLNSLTKGENRLLGERLIRQLGLARDEKAIKTGLDLVRAQVSLLAKGT